MSTAKVEMYFSSLCGYCQMARQLLDSKGVDYLLYLVDRNMSLRQEARDRSGRQTVPQIFINGQSVGGYDDIAALDRAGELDKLLAQPYN